MEPRLKFSSVQFWLYTGCGIRTLPQVLMAIRDKVDALLLSVL